MLDAKRERWTADDIPDLSGQTIIVTGGNSGIGYEAALQFARHHAHTILACRSLAKADGAAKQIAAVASEFKDRSDRSLTYRASRRFAAFAEAFHKSHRSLNVLVNNAGVMALPYSKTEDGFEMQFGTNHLGHFALTGLLLDTLLASAGARVVGGGQAARIGSGRIRFDDLQLERSYNKWLAYGQSKLANLLFTFELQRRAAAAGAKLIAVACHPGYAATNLQGAGPRMQGSSGMESFWRMSNSAFAQTSAMGALPTLYRGDLARGAAWRAITSDPADSPNCGEILLK